MAAGATKAVLVSVLVLVTAAIGWARVAAAQEAVTATEARAFGLDQEAALRLSQSVVGQSPSDYKMLDRAGEPVRLAQYLSLIHI